MVDLSYLARRLIYALDPASQGGAAISAEEIADIKSGSGDLPGGLVEFAADIIGQQDLEGARISKKEIQQLEQKHPEFAARLIAELEKSRLWPAGTRLFSNDAQSYLRSKKDSATRELAAFLRKELSFPQDERALTHQITEIATDATLESLSQTVHSPKFKEFAQKFFEIYRTGRAVIQPDLSTCLQIYKSEPLSKALLSDGFAEFAELLAKHYKTNVFADPESAAVMFKEPSIVESLEDERTQRVFERLDRIFHFEQGRALIMSVNVSFSGLTSANPLFLQALAARSDLDKFLTEVGRHYRKLQKDYGDAARVTNTRDLENFLNLFDNSTQGLVLRSTVYRDAFRFIVRKFGLSLSIYDCLRTMALLSLAARDGNLEALKQIRTTREKGRTLARIGPWSFEIFTLEDVKSLALLQRSPDSRELFEIANLIGDGGLELAGTIGAMGYPRGDVLTALRLKARLYPDVAVGSRLDLEALTSPDFSRLIASNEARAVHAAFKRRLGNTPFQLNEFVSMLRRNAGPFFINGDNASACHETLAELSTSEHGSTLDLDLCIESGAQGLQNLNSPLGSQILAALRKMARIEATSLQDFGGHIDTELLDALRYIERHPAVSKMRLGHDATQRLMMHPNHLLELARDLRRPEIASAFEMLAQAGAVSAATMSDIERVSWLAEDPSKVRLIIKLSELMGQALSSAETDRMHRNGGQTGFSIEGTFGGLLHDSSFGEFCRRVRQDYFENRPLSMDDIKTLAGLFPKARVFYGENFKRLLAMVRTDQRITHPDLDMLGQLLQVAESINFRDIDRLLPLMGRRISSNDLPLVAAISKSQELQELLRDRRRLLAEAAEIYTLPEIARTGGVSISSGYTERPPLSDLDSMSLLRLVVLHRALKEKRTLAEIGAIVARDIQDKRTEYGGQILLGNGTLHFNNVRSTSESDGSYSNSLSSLLNGGLMSFHLHALTENEPGYAGPSGNPQTAAFGDWSVARSFRRTDVVLTTLGPVEGSTNELWINVDMYYVNDKGMAVVIDLGRHRVPRQ